MFLSTINTDELYHVFLTPLGGGTANVAFDYRIVAIRKGYEQVRMEPLTEGGKPMVVDIPAAPSVASEPGEP